jgi:hypothetical protein
VLSLRVVNAAEVIAGLEVLNFSEMGYRCCHVKPIISSMKQGIRNGSVESEDGEGVF